MAVTTIRGGRQITDATIPYADIQNVTANTILGNNTASAAAIQEVSLSTNTLLGRGASNIAAISLGTGLSISTSTLTLGTNLQSLTGLTYVSASFVKMTAAGTFGLDTSTYISGSTGAVDKAILRANGTGGVTLQSSSVVISDTANITLGTTSLAGSTRDLISESSATDCDIRLLAKGVGKIWLDAQANQYIYLALRGNTATDRVLATKPLASTTSIAYPLAVQSELFASSVAVGAGVGIEFISYTSSTTTKIGAAINTVSTNITSTTENFDLVFKNMAAGAAAAERLRVISTGQLKISAYTTSTSFSGTATGYLAFDSSGNVISVAVPSVGTTTNALTFNNAGSGAASGSTFNGSAAVTVSYNTIGAQASSTNLTSLSGLTYVSASFVKMTAAGTFSLDTSTYEPAITTLAISKGGTGTGTAPTQYGVIYASSTTAYASTAAGTSTQVLHGNAAGAPTWGAVSLTADVSGTLPVGNGGTGATTLTGALIGSGTSAITAVAGTALQLFRRNAGNTAYEFFTPTYVTTLFTNSAVGTPFVGATQTNTATTSAVTHQGAPFNSSMPANTLTAGRIAKFTYTGRYTQTSTSTTTLTITIGAFGATWTTGAFPITAALSNAGFEIELTVLCLTAGASGTAYSSLKFTSTSTAANGTPVLNKIITNIVATAPNSQTVSINTTNATTNSLTTQLSVAGTVIFNIGRIEIY